MKIENEADALAAVKNNGWALKYVPESLRSAEICRAAVDRNWQALQYVQPPLLTAELCRAAVAQDGQALKYVPPSLRSAEICRAAGLSLADVPKIDDIHREVYAAASRPGALNMTVWSSHCGTVHCRAGWVVTLAGEAGAALREKVGTPAAAALIYQVSDPEMSRDPDWCTSKDAALADMARMARAENDALAAEQDGLAP